VEAPTVARLVTTVEKEDEVDIEAEAMKETNRTTATKPHPISRDTLPRWGVMYLNVSMKELNRDSLLKRLRR
jgi:hypothetical protein